MKDTTDAHAGGSATVTPDCPWIIAREPLSGILAVILACVIIAVMIYWKWRRKQ